MDVLCRMSLFTDANETNWSLNRFAFILTIEFYTELELLLMTVCLPLCKHQYYEKHLVYAGLVMVDYHSKSLTGK